MIGDVFHPQGELGNRVLEWCQKVGRSGEKKMPKNAKFREVIDREILVVNKQGEGAFLDYQHFRYVFYRKGYV